MSDDVATHILAIEIREYNDGCTLAELALTNSDGTLDYNPKLPSGLCIPCQLRSLAEHLEELAAAGCDPFGIGTQAELPFG